MGLESQFQMGMKQRVGRKKKRDKLTAKGANLNEYFYGKYYIKASSK